MSCGIGIHLRRRAILSIVHNEPLRIEHAEHGHIALAHLPVDQILIPRQLSTVIAADRFVKGRSVGIGGEAYRRV